MNEISLDENDIRTLETGTLLRKLKNGEFNKRFYHLDLVHNQLLATTKEIGKSQKKYLLTSVDEVKAGCCSDGLRDFIKSNEHKSHALKASDMESLSFVITYDNYTKKLELMAYNQLDRDRWVRVLDYFILLCKKRKGVLPVSDAMKTNLFTKADKNNSKTLNKDEMLNFMTSMNLKLNKNKFKKYLEESDLNKDGKLNEEEFQLFMNNLMKRNDIYSLFKLAKRQVEGESKQEHLSLRAFQAFLKKYQKEDKTENQCQQLFEQFEPTELKESDKLSIYGFINYLNDPAQFIDHDDHFELVYQNMNLPMSHYFINSSHNTYLDGDQITSVSSAENYKAALMKGARLVELDCHDGSDGQPRIFHQMTLTTKVLFEDVIKAVKEYAFVKSQYPVILTCELHCSIEQQRVMAQIIKRHLNEFLFTDPLDPDNVPVLEKLKRKVFIRCAKPKVKVSLDKCNSAEENQMEDETFEELQELTDLVNVIQSTKFNGLDHAFFNYKLMHVPSLSEKECNKLIDSESASRLIHYTRKFLTKVYPAFYRQDSSNLNALNYWLYGFQIVALNFQTNDTPMQLNQALFRDNGGCGYVLKPDILIKRTTTFDPLDTNTMTNKKQLDIRIISAQNLPSDNDIVRDISDPFVQVQIYGVPDDNASLKTKTVNDNGHNPFWNENLSFTINCPEMAFVKFVIRDEDVGTDDVLGDFTIRFQNMRSGYRHIKLKNKKSRGTLFVGIKITNL